jgi:hypothetical protein
MMSVQVYTSAPELPVLVMPGYTLRQSYELWEGATKRTRLCDGVDEELSGGPCLCEQEGEDRCDIYTRVVVALQELDTVLGWRLITRGANAAHELPTMMSFVEAHSGGATFVPARLRIDDRRGVKDGQVVRFVVPVLDLALGYLALAKGEKPPVALQAPVSDADGETWVPAVREPGNADAALDALTRPRTGLGRNQPELPVPDVEPVPADEAPDDGTVEETSYTDERQTKKLTKPQSDGLDALVGQLRDGGHITTRSLWEAIGKLRDENVEDMIARLGGESVDGVLHWSPLRTSLLRPEASQLFEWLQTKAARVGLDRATASAS